MIRNRSKQLVAIFLLAPMCGCATPLLDSYVHEKSFHCRIDNPDRDSVWDTSDENGNGVIDENETAGPVFDFASLGGPFAGDGTSLDTIVNQSARGAQPTPGGRDLKVQTITFADEIIYNPDDDVINGFFIVSIDTDRDGIPDTDVASGVDFDDLHTFNLAFDRFLVAVHAETWGMQFARKHRFTSKLKTQDQPSHSFELAYGARHLRLQEKFFFEGLGSFLGRTSADMDYDNRMLGPQVALNWHRQHGDWSLHGGGSLMLGYNFAKAHQIAIVGESRSPGAINRSLTAQPNEIISSREHEEFASIAEFNAAASYRLRSNLKLVLGYRALYMSELRHAGESVDMSLPNFGILDRGASNAWLEGLHASVEWRR